MLKSLTSMLLAGTIGLSAVSAFAAEDYSGHTLVVGVWGGDIERLLRENAADPIEKETGAKVEFVLGGTGDRMARIYAEKDNPTMDIAFLNMYEAPQALADGIVNAPDPDSDMYKNIWDGMNNGCYAMSLVGLGIAYNKTLVDHPPEWKDMWDPQYNGKIAVSQYPGSEGDGLIGVAARLAGTDEHDPDAAFAKLEELKPIAMTYTNLDEVFAMMDAGEVVMAPMISGYVLSALKEHPDIGFSFPTDPGPVLVRDMLCTVKNSPEPELAKMFAEKALGVKNQTDYAEQIYFGPTNKNVKLPETVSADVIDTPEEVDSLVQLDWPYVISQRSDWTQRWNKDLLGQ
ncbi:extracellular solute-binding protein [Martelella alba]|uniref:Extracellular solute-binding protein n=1 Tax=Martelella alba TaxID=2590451 RepID=A0A506UIP2_9HYPH|nr:extracellular solute-binding protein [Martelella alba]TPW33189.1 extracellular solute-binding protein [Martelella alba]